MIDRDGNQPLTSDGMSTLNPEVPIDFGHESGIGSDSDSTIGTDPTLTPGSPSLRPSSTDHPLSTSGDMSSTELLSADKPDWLQLADQCASDMPSDVINMRLDEKYARLVLQPPPPNDCTPEVNSTAEVDSPHCQLSVEKRHGRRLPAVPVNETRFDQLPDPVYRFDRRQLRTAAAVARCNTDDDDDDDAGDPSSAELWKRAALITDSPRRCHDNHSTADQTGSRNHETHVSPADVTSAAAGHHKLQTLTQLDDELVDNSNVVTISTFPRSRAQRQPISDVAPASSCACPIGNSSDDVTLQDTGEPAQPTRPQGEVHNVGQNLDRKSIENGTEHRKWRSQVNDMSFYINGNSRHPGDVIKPEVTSDRKLVEYVTSSGRYKKHHATSQLPEMDHVNGRSESSMNVTCNYQHHLHGGPSAEGEMRSAKLLERRLGAAGRGRMIQQQQMKLMIDQLNSKQRELRAAERSPGSVSSESSHQGSTTASGGEQTRSYRRQQSLESMTSAPQSPNQHVSPTWTPTQHQYVSPVAPLMLQSCPGLGGELDVDARRRQLEYEAGLRRFGPNHKPQHCCTADADDGQRQRHTNTGTHTCLLTHQY